MVRPPVAVLLLLYSLPALLLAQQKVNPANTHERLLCVVPLVGAGTPEDPRRPMFAPAAPGQEDPASRQGILGWNSIPSDDGQFALVEFVAADRAAFRPILDAKRPDVKVFTKGKAKRADIETEFRRFRRGFSVEDFEVAVP